MHASSLAHMTDLVARYVPAAPLRVLDIGSYDVNGSYKPLLQGRARLDYVGIDLSPGPNVDLVLSSPYRFPLPSASADLVISGQTFEHVEFFWLTWLEMVRVLKPHGHIFLIAPSRGPEHRYPVDCWRFYADGFTALARYGRVELLEVHTDWAAHADADSAQWGDTVGVFRKPDTGPRSRIRQRMRQQISRFLSIGY